MRGDGVSPSSTPFLPLRHHKIVQKTAVDLISAKFCEKCELEGDADLAFRAKVSIEANSNEPSEKNVVLALSEEDASKLEALTQDSFGKWLVIVFQNGIIAAPRISVPLASNQVMFKIENGEAFERLLKEE